jgi:hypothetical protein
MAIMGAVERFATILFHLSATVLVLRAFRRNNILWLFLAICWHTVIDATAVFASSTWSIYLTEGIIMTFGFLSLGIVFLLKTQNQSNVAVSQFKQSEPIEKLSNENKIVELSEADLENSKYA